MKYFSNLDSIRSHPLPEWYDDCKLGIFIHWGLYSVPAFAPKSGQLGTIELDERWFANNPYAEWYYNSVKIGHGPSYDYHVNTYGKDFAYEGFADMWKAERFDPQSWAKLFKKAGAGYVVLTTKHHDGFCLWPSEYTDYNAAKHGPGRDLFGELTAAVRGEGLHMGAYYSGIIDWRYTKRPVTCGYECDYPDNVSYAYSDYAYNQVMELIDRYEPSVLWNDIGWPVKGYTDLPYLISYYYNRVPEGVISDRWMVNKDDFWYDFSTKEYQVGAARVDKKWEMTRGLGLSFGYNQTEGEADCIGKDELIRLLIDTVAHNGNLLLNIGPKADGTIPSVQEERLLYLGAWLEQNGEGIYGTRPYRTPELKEKNGGQLYFTQKGDAVYLFVAAPRDGENVICMENIFGTTAKLTDLQGNAIPYKMEDELLRFTVNAKGTAPVAVRVQI